MIEPNCSQAKVIYILQLRCMGLSLHLWNFRSIGMLLVCRPHWPVLFIVHYCLFL